MKAIGIIPSRYASTRFPGKPLLDIGGKSMIWHVYQNASKAKLLEEIIVATDDDRIFSHVRDFGGKVMMSSHNHRSGTDRCGELAQHIKADVIVNIQGDEPLVNPQQLDELVATFRDKKIQIATLGIKTTSLEDIKNPNRIKIVVNKNNQALYFSRSPIPNSDLFSGEDSTFYPYLKHVGLYAFRHEILLKLVDLPQTKLEQIESLEQLRWLYHGYPIQIIETNIETPNIDVPEDIHKVLAILSKKRA